MKMVILALVPFLTGAAAPPPLKFTSPDAATAVYADKCSNGKNHDLANREKFVKRMLLNPQSRLAILKAQLLKGLEDPSGEGVFVGQFVETYNDRSGCGTSNTSYSAPLAIITGGNAFHTVTRYLVTIDDNDEAGLRTLALRSFQPVTIRDDQ
jgi:hypothetical protein